MKKITMEINRDIELYEEHRKNPLFAENDFSDDDFNELIGLLRRKQDYLLQNYRTDNSWEWTANLHFIVSGTKPDVAAK